VRAQITPETRLLAAQVRVRDPATLRRIAAVLRRNGGDVAATAAELGVSRRTFYLWREQIPEFDVVVAPRVRAPGRPANGTPRRSRGRARRSRCASHLLTKGVQ
jgi:transposase-like protein